MIKWQTYEDPDYFVDEDDADWEDMEDVAEKPQKEEFGPYETVNS